MECTRESMDFFEEEIRKDSVKILSKYLHIVSLNLNQIVLIYKSILYNYTREDKHIYSQPLIDR